MISQAQPLVKIQILRAGSVYLQGLKCFGERRLVMRRKLFQIVVSLGNGLSGSHKVTKFSEPRGVWG